jgi:hypothetical protein
LFCLNPEELLPLIRVSTDFGFLRASQCSVWLSQCKRLWANRLPLDDQQLSLEFDATSAVTLLFRSLHPVPTQLNKYLMPTGARTIWTVSEPDAEDEADSHELLSVQRCVRFNGGQTGQNRCVRANRPFPSPTQAGLLPFTTLSVGPGSKAGSAASAAGRGDSKRSGGGGGESKRRSSSSGAASVEGLLSTAQQRRVVARLSTIGVTRRACCFLLLTTSVSIPAQRTLRSLLEGHQSPLLTTSTFRCAVLYCLLGGSCPDGGFRARWRLRRDRAGARRVPTVRPHARLDQQLVGPALGRRQQSQLLCLAVASACF